MAGGSFDFRDVKRLQKQMEEIERGRDVFCRECARELAARLLAKVIRRTPVGHAPKLDSPTAIKVKGADGKERTVLSRSGAIRNRYWAGYVGGSLRRSWTTGRIQKVGDQYEIEVINPMEYASYVEYGHRQTPGRYVPALGKRLKKGWVRGEFMMTISEKEVKSLAPKLLEKRLGEYLRGCVDGQ